MKATHRPAPVSGTDLMGLLNDFAIDGPTGGEPPPPAAAAASPISPSPTSVSASASASPLVAAAAAAAPPPPHTHRPHRVIPAPPQPPPIPAPSAGGEAWGTPVGAPRQRSMSPPAEAARAIASDLRAKLSVGSSPVGQERLEKQEAVMNGLAAVGETALKDALSGHFETLSLKEAQGQLDALRRELAERTRENQCLKAEARAGNRRLRLALNGDDATDGADAAAADAADAAGGGVEGCSGDGVAGNERLRAFKERQQQRERASKPAGPKGKLAAELEALRGRTAELETRDAALTKHLQALLPVEEDRRSLQGERFLLAETAASLSVRCAEADARGAVLQAFGAGVAAACAEAQAAGAEAAARAASLEEGAARDAAARAAAEERLAAWEEAHVPEQELREEKERLEEELQESRRAVEALRDEVSSGTEAFVEARDRLARSDGAAAILRAEVTHLSERLAEASALLSDKEGRMARTMADLQSSSLEARTADALGEECEALRARTDTLERRLAAADAASAELARSTVRNASLEDENRALHRRLDAGGGGAGDEVVATLRAELATLNKVLRNEHPARAAVHSAVADLAEEHAKLIEATHARDSSAVAATPLRAASRDRLGTVIRSAPPLAASPSSSDGDRNMESVFAQASSSTIRSPVEGETPTTATTVPAAASPAAKLPQQLRPVPLLRASLRGRSADFDTGSLLDTPMGTPQKRQRSATTLVSFTGTFDDEPHDRSGDKCTSPLSLARVRRKSSVGITGLDSTIQLNLHEMGKRDGSAGFDSDDEEEEDDEPPHSPATEDMEAVFEATVPSSSTLRPSNKSESLSDTDTAPRLPPSVNLEAAASSASEQQQAGQTPSSSSAAVSTTEKRGAGGTAGANGGDPRSCSMSGDSGVLLALFSDTPPMKPVDVAAAAAAAAPPLQQPLRQRLNRRRSRTLGAVGGRDSPTSPSNVSSFPNATFDQDPFGIVVEDVDDDESRREERSPTGSVMSSPPCLHETRASLSPATSLAAHPHTHLYDRNRITRKRSATMTVGDASAELLGSPTLDSSGLLAPSFDRAPSSPLDCSSMQLSTSLFARKQQSAAHEAGSGSAGAASWGDDPLLETKTEGRLDFTTTIGSANASFHSGAGSAGGGQSTGGGGGGGGMLHPQITVSKFYQHLEWFRWYRHYTRCLASCERVRDFMGWEEARLREAVDEEGSDVDPATGTAAWQKLLAPLACGVLRGLVERQHRASQRKGMKRHGSTESSAAAAAAAAALSSFASSEEDEDADAKVAAARAALSTPEKALQTELSHLVPETQAARDKLAQAIQARQMSITHTAHQSGLESAHLLSIIYTLLVADEAPASPTGDGQPQAAAPERDERDLLCATARSLSIGSVGSAGFDSKLAPFTLPTPILTHTTRDNAVLITASYKASGGCCVASGTGASHINVNLRSSRFIFIRRGVMCEGAAKLQQLKGQQPTTLPFFLNIREKEFIHLQVLEEPGTCSGASKGKGTAVIGESFLPLIAVEGSMLCETVLKLPSESDPSEPAATLTLMIEGAVVMGCEGLLTENIKLMTSTGTALEDNTRLQEALLASRSHLLSQNNTAEAFNEYLAAAHRNPKKASPGAAGGGGGGTTPPQAPPPPPPRAEAYTRSFLYSRIRFLRPDTRKCEYLVFDAEHDHSSPQLLAAARRDVPQLHVFPALAVCESQATTPATAPAQVPRGGDGDESSAPDEFVCDDADGAGEEAATNTTPPSAAEYGLQSSGLLSSASDVLAAMSHSQGGPSPEHQARRLTARVEKQLQRLAHFRADDGLAGSDQADEDDDDEEEEEEEEADSKASSRRLAQTEKQDASGTAGGSAAAAVGDPLVLLGEQVARLTQKCSELEASVAAEGRVAATAAAAAAGRPDATPERGRKSLRQAHRRSGLVSTLQSTLRRAQNEARLRGAFGALLAAALRARPPPPPPAAREQQQQQRRPPPPPLAPLPSKAEYYVGASLVPSPRAAEAALRLSTSSSSTSTSSSAVAASACSAPLSLPCGEPDAFDPEESASASASAPASAPVSPQFATPLSAFGALSPRGSRPDLRLSPAVLQKHTALHFPDDADAAQAQTPSAGEQSSWTAAADSAAASGGVAPVHDGVMLHEGRACIVHGGLVGGGGGAGSRIHDLQQTPSLTLIPVSTPTSCLNRRSSFLGTPLQEFTATAAAQPPQFLWAGVTASGHGDGGWAFVNEGVQQPFFDDELAASTNTRRGSAYKIVSFQDAAAAARPSAVREDGDSPFNLGQPGFAGSGSGSGSKGCAWSAQGGGVGAAAVADVDTSGDDDDDDGDGAAKWGRLEEEFDIQSVPSLHSIRSVGSTRSLPASHAGMDDPLGDTAKLFELTVHSTQSLLSASSVGKPPSREGSTCSPRRRRPPPKQLNMAQQLVPLPRETLPGGCGSPPLVARRKSLSDLVAPRAAAAAAAAAAPKVVRVSLRGVSLPAAQCAGVSVGSPSALFVGLRPKAAAGSPRADKKGGGGGGIGGGGSNASLLQYLDCGEVDAVAASPRGFVEVAPRGCRVWAAAAASPLSPAGRQAPAAAGGLPRPLGAVGGSAAEPAELSYSVPAPEAASGLGSPTRANAKFEVFLYTSEPPSTLVRCVGSGFFVVDMREGQEAAEIQVKVRFLPGVAAVLGPAAAAEGGAASDGYGDDAGLASPEGSPRSGGGEIQKAVVTLAVDCGGGGGGGGGAGGGGSRGKAPSAAVAPADGRPQRLVRAHSAIPRMPVQAMPPKAGVSAAATTTPSEKELESYPYESVNVAHAATSPLHPPPLPRPWRRGSGAEAEAEEASPACSEKGTETEPAPPLAAHEESLCVARAEAAVLPVHRTPRAAVADAATDMNLLERYEFTVYDSPPAAVAAAASAAGRTADAGVNTCAEYVSAATAHGVQTERDEALANAEKLLALLRASQEEAGECARAKKQLGEELEACRRQQAAAAAAAGLQDAGGPSEREELEAVLEEVCLERDRDIAALKQEIERQECLLCEGEQEVARLREELLRAGGGGGGRGGGEDGATTLSYSPSGSSDSASSPLRGRSVPTPQHQQQAPPPPPPSEPPALRSPSLAQQSPGGAMAAKLLLSEYQAEIAVLEARLAEERKLRGGGNGAAAAVFGSAPARAVEAYCASPCDATLEAASNAIVDDPSLSAAVFGEHARVYRGGKRSGVASPPPRQQPASPYSAVPRGAAARSAEGQEAEMDASASASASAWELGINACASSTEARVELSAGTSPRFSPRSFFRTLSAETGVAERDLELAAAYSVADGGGVRLSFRVFAETPVEADALLSDVATRLAAMGVVGGRSVESVEVAEGAGGSEAAGASQSLLAACTDGDRQLAWLVQTRAPLVDSLHRCFTMLLLGGEAFVEATIHLEKTLMSFLTETEKLHLGMPASPSVQTCLTDTQLSRLLRHTPAGSPTRLRTLHRGGGSGGC